MKRFIILALVSLASFSVAIPIGYHIGFAAGAEYEGVTIMKSYSTIIDAPPDSPEYKFTDLMVSNVIDRGVQIRSSYLGLPLGLFSPLDQEPLHSAYKHLAEYDAVTPYKSPCGTLEAVFSDYTEDDKKRCKQFVISRKKFVDNLGT